MYVCICMYVCMHACMYVCMYVCMYIVCMYVCMYVYSMYVYSMYVCMYLRLHHEASLPSQAQDKVENIQCTSINDHLQHTLNSYQCTSSAHTSTVMTSHSTSQGKSF